MALLHLLKINLVCRKPKWHIVYSLYMNALITCQSFLGGKHHRFKRGYKNVIDEAVRLVSWDSDLSFTCWVLGQLTEARNQIGKFAYASLILVPCIGVDCWTSNNAGWMKFLTKWDLILVFLKVGCKSIWKLPWGNCHLMINLIYNVTEFV
jgi:hypothetical protein